MAESSSNLQELQEDFDIYTTLLKSLREEFPDGTMKDDEEELENKLKETKSRLESMGVSFSKESTKSTTPYTTNPSPAAPNTNHTKPTQHTNLPTRKRNREDFEDNSNAGPSKKRSQSSTATTSPALSVASIDSNYFDDPSLAELFGDELQENVRRNKAFWRERELKRRQEEEDERLAREIEEQWNNIPAVASQPSRLAYNPASFNQQAVFRPDGSFSAPIASVKQERSNPPHSQTSTPGTPNTSSSDDDSLTFVSPAEWRARFPSSSGPSRVLPPSFNASQPIPRAFPFGSQTPQSGPYASTAGASVYFPQPLARLPALDRLAGAISSGLGSMRQPFDLDFLSSAFPSRYSQSPLPREWESVDPAQTQEEIRQLLSHIRPDEEISMSEAGENQPLGLKVKLMPHQVKGLAWMKAMEDGTNKGGILADDMGLGKTIQALALMLSRPLPDNAKKPTLIVTPVALMEQWKREMTKLIRPNHQFTVEILHGNRARTSWNKIKHYDVVLTSYGTLAAELKRKVALDEKIKQNPEYQPKKVDECSVLDEKASFYRVILDEAQNIKNKNTKAAHAACRIQAQFRWCLSGTPMQNNVEEIYSLIKFCRIRPYNDPEKFNRDISRPLKAHREAGQERAMEKLQALLKAILLRRTKKSTIDGQPILQLPDKHTVEDRTIFDKDQLEFYKNLEAQTQIQFNKYVRNGTVGQNYSKALVLLLRLRQCCCSPQLVTNSADFVTDSGVEGIDLVANARELPNDVVNRVKEQEDLECPICMDACDNAIIFNPCGHALCHDCFSRMVDNVMQEEGGNVKCPHCRARIDTKKITDHASFAEVYLGAKPAGAVDGEGDDADDADESTDVDSDSDEDEVESDGSDDGADLRDFVVDDDDSTLFLTDTDNDDDDLDPKLPSVDLPQVLNKSKPDAIPKKKKRAKKSKSKKLKKDKKKKEHKSLADLRKEGLKSKAAKRKYLRQLKKIYVPCAKIDKTLSLLQEIYDRQENEKTIVFSSFTSFLDLVEVPLHEHQVLKNYTRYDGSMTAKERNAAVLRFTDDPNCRVILVSLKAGNAGLNLTIANHVIILDPFWNPFVEYQAADRCHRIGQRREVTVHRVLIGEEGVDYEDLEGEPNIFTVEDRILALQAKKKRLVESALDESAASQVGRLGVRELGYLFGVNEMPTNSGR